MLHANIFPPRVQEVIDFIKSGEILSSAYKLKIPMRFEFDDVGAALKHYVNQDVDKPMYFLPDIASDAAGEIPSMVKDAAVNGLKYKLIAYEEQEDFYKMVYKNIEGLKKELSLKDAQLKLMADMISGDLYYCAKSRLMSYGEHPFFENLFLVYKNQGLPCGWKGSGSWEKGDFLIYTR